MALGADEPLAGALQPQELPLPSPAFLAVGSGGRGINLLLALPCTEGGWSPCTAPCPTWGCWRCSRKPAVPAVGSPTSASTFPGGLLAVPGSDSCFTGGPSSVQAGGAQLEFGGTWWEGDKGCTRQEWSWRGLEPSQASPVLMADPSRAGIFLCALNTSGFSLPCELLPSPLLLPGG